MRVAGAARLGGGEFGGHRLAEDHRARFAQGNDACSIALGAPAEVYWGAVFGREVSSLDDVLDADRHAVDLAERPASAPARARRIGRNARGIDVEMHEGANFWLERGEIGKAAFEKLARRIGAVAKSPGRREVRLRCKLELLFGR